MLRIAAFLSLFALVGMSVNARSDEPPLTMIVMDPLAAPLSCPCVKGYAQRDYEKLAKHLEAKLGRPVQVFFGESLTATLLKKSAGKADVIIGKESVVRHESTANKIDAVPVASLTGKDGKTTMTGLVLVPAKDSAITAADLKGYRIFFGPTECDEKYSAAKILFEELGVSISEKPTVCASCSDGATKVLDLAKRGEKAATVISSYAQPLLEGCGTIRKGDLRVVGETDPVPFVVAFVNGNQPREMRAEITRLLLEVGRSKDCLAALETKEGFVALPGKKK